jgi:hypothetical protein
MPPHILTQIALHLLGDTLPDPAPKSDHQTKLLPEESIIDLLSLTRTCSHLRDIHIASHVWHTVVLHQVLRFKLALLARWRANPTGVGSASNLFIALDEDFAVPVEKALADGRFVREDGQGWTAQDVLHWWMYDPAWRSRRRVWTCVVHACATARDADWW